HGVQIVLRQILRGLLHDLGHGARRGRVRIAAGTEVLRDVALAPAAESVALARTEIGCEYVFGKSSLHRMLAVCRTEEILVGMAGAAMTCALHQISAAIPLRRVLRIGLEPI